MGDWPIHAHIANAAQTGGGLGIVTHASAHTKGDYTELVASTSFACNMLMIAIDSSTTTFEFLFDLAIGAAGSETVIIANIPFSTETGDFYSHSNFVFPVNLPAGTRIAMRGQSSTGNKTIYANLQYFSNNWMRSSFSCVTTYGANTADSGGVSVDCGGSAWTKGDYSEITSATSRAHKGLIIGIGNQLNTNRVATAFFIDIAIGPATETVLIPSFGTACNGSFATIKPNISPLYLVDIPAGSRLTARAACGTTDASDRLLDIILYGLS